MAGTLVELNIMPKENPITTRVLGSLSQYIQQVSVALPDQLVPM